MKTSELSGALLDYWVARAEGLVDRGLIVTERLGVSGVWLCGFVPYRPSSDWSQGGPIIDREKITLLDPEFCKSGLWEAFMGAFLDVRKDDIVGKVAEGFGPTPLIAAMRAFVASKFGEEVPDTTKIRNES